MKTDQRGYHGFGDLMKIFPSSLGIATVLTVLFGGLVVFSTGGLLAISLLITFDTTRQTLTDKVEDLLDETMRLSQSFYEPIQTQANWLAGEIRSGRIDPDNTEQFQAILLGVVGNTEQVSAVSYQRPDGTGYFYDPIEDILHSVEWPRAWQARLNTRREGPQTWPATEGQWVLRPSVLDGTRLGTFLVPVRDGNGQDSGVVAIRRNQVPLARTLSKDASVRGHEFIRFMLFDDRIVIGHPELADKPKSVRISVDELEDPFLKEIDKVERHPVVFLNEIRDATSFQIETETGSRIFILRPVREYVAGAELLVGVHFDPRAGTPEVMRVLAQAGLGLSILVAAIILSIWLGRRAAAPMRRLAFAAEQVQKDRLDDLARLPVGKVKELASASAAFNGMVDGLRERKRIRDLFGKYVPENVASLLLSDDAASQPRNATATILFLDLVGFSRMSEKLPPQEVVNAMNAFFSDAVRIIEDHQGMVAQFQGDALLAVFNVPIARKHHAEAAVKAALAILVSVQQNTYGNQRLECRIGINTGFVVAGAIGAQDRLSYTVYGDAVNVAARLESLNKETGTRILVSDSTAALVHNTKFQPMGEVSLKGRSASVKVYSVTA